MRPSPLLVLTMAPALACSDSPDRPTYVLTGPLAPTRTSVQMSTGETRQCASRVAGGGLPFAGLQRVMGRSSSRLGNDISLKIGSINVAREPSAFVDSCRSYNAVGSTQIGTRNTSAQLLSALASAIGHGLSTPVCVRARQIPAEIPAT